MLNMILVASLLAVPACNKDSLGFDGHLDKDDYLIFGIYHGECLGDCLRLFKLENGQLFADDRDWGFERPIPFMTTPLDESAYHLAEPLFTGFPEALLESDQRTYGCPDCADQGGYYLELRDGGKVNIWHIDTRDEDQGPDILGYKAALQDVLDQLL